MPKRRTARPGQPVSGSPASPCVIILAAGAGSRMRSTLPTALHRVAGRTLIESVLEAAESLPAARTVVVLGPSHRQVEPLIAGRAETARGDSATGTAEAVRRALAQSTPGDGSVVVLPGTAPLVRGATLRSLLERQRSGRRDLVLLSCVPPDAAAFHRVVRGRGGRIQRLASPGNIGLRNRKPVESSPGIYCFDRSALERALAGLSKGSSARDIAEAVEILARRRGAVEALEVDWREAWIVRTRRDLAAAEEIVHRQGVERALDLGATVIDPATTRIGPAVSIEPDTVIHPFVILEGRTALSSGCEVLSFTRIADSQVAALAIIGPHCDVEGARIGERTRVGPYARLRPGTVLEADVRVGNFVETKEAVLRRGVKALHHSYLGDAEIGPNANIGAGVITCNFDGQVKHRTVVGANAFVGSDTQLVAPVTVGEGAYIGAGSTITEDVPAGALALTRVPQKNSAGWVERRKRRHSS